MSFSILQLCCARSSLSGSRHFQPKSVEDSCLPTGKIHSQPAEDLCCTSQLSAGVCAKQPQNSSEKGKFSVSCTIHHKDIIPSFISPKLTHYVSPEGSIVEQAFTCLCNLEQSSSCSNLTSQCHAQPVTIYSNTTHFHVGHIDEVSVHSNEHTDDSKLTRAWKK